MMIFKEIDSSEIKQSYASYFNEKARYFMINKNTDFLCYCGIIDINDEVGEAFLMFKSFNGKVLSKELFLSLFDHFKKLGYKETYTWTTIPAWVRLFSHFNRFGLEKVNCPEWDKDPSKTWFVKRI